jgi:hypothetical protein
VRVSGADPRAHLGIQDQENFGHDARSSARIHGADRLGRRSLKRQEDFGEDILIVRVCADTAPSSLPPSGQAEGDSYKGKRILVKTL